MSEDCHCIDVEMGKNLKISDGPPLAAWQNGVQCSSFLTQESRDSLPFFPREVTVCPYFDAEAEFVAKVLSLRDPDVVGVWLRDGKVVNQLKVFDCGIDELLQTVEGEI